MRTVWRLNDAAATALIEQGASVAEVAKVLEVSRQAVNHAIRKGRIPAPSTRLGASSASTPDGTPSNSPRVGDTNGGTR